jgi:hypothetical protein
MPLLRICDNCPLSDIDGEACTIDGCRLSIKTEYGRLAIDGEWHTFSEECTAALVWQGEERLPPMTSTEVLLGPDPDIHKQRLDPELTKYFDEKLRQASIEQDVFNHLPSSVVHVRAQFGIHEDPC